MKRFSRKYDRGGSRKGEAARRQLIVGEMRFVLHQNEGQFAKLLLARLLDEGCNLHPHLARKMFYKLFEHWLRNILPVNVLPRIYEKVAGSNKDLNHSRYHKAVKYSIKHLSDAETQLTAAVLDIIATITENWRQMAENCLPGADGGDANLQNLIARIKRVNPNGNLAQHGLETIRRRLRIALATSLMRHVRQPDLLRKKHGGVLGALKEINREPECFASLMRSFKMQIPYFQHVVAQTFWRTLNNLDTEIPDPAPRTKIY